MVTFAVVFTLSAISALSAGRKAKELNQYKDETGRIATKAYLLDYGRLAIFPMGAMVFFLVLFVLLTGAPNAGTPEDKPYAYGLFALVLVLTWPLFLEFIGTYVVITETGIKKRSLYRGTRSLNWSELDLVGVWKTSYGPSFTFAGSGKTLSIGIWMSGSRQVLDSIDKFCNPQKVVHASNFSEINSYVLGYRAERNLPPTSQYIVASLCIIFSAVVMLWLWSASTYNDKDIAHWGLNGWILWTLLELPNFLALAILAYAWKRREVKFFVIAAVISAFSIVAPVPVLAIIFLWRSQRKQRSGQSRTQEEYGFESSKLFLLRKSRRRAHNLFRYCLVIGAVGIALGLFFTLDSDTIVEGWTCIAASFVTLTMGLINFYQMKVCDKKILLLTRQSWPVQPHGQTQPISENPSQSVIDDFAVESGEVYTHGKKVNERGRYGAAQSGSALFKSRSGCTVHWRI